MSSPARSSFGDGPAGVVGHGDRQRRRRRAEVIVLFASIVFLGFSFWSARQVEAVSLQYSVYPGLINSGGLAEYGWHFDEGGYPWFGARDYNGASYAYFRANLNQTQSLQTRWKLTHHGVCGVRVNQQQLYWYGWVDNSGTDFHYLHLSWRPSSPTYTAVVQGYGDNVATYVGTLDYCGTSELHLHQSGDLSGPSYVYRVPYSNDTCWVDSDVGQCPSTYRVDNGSSCPPSSWSGYGGVSGTIARYSCELWSAEYKADWQKTFEVQW